jgi:hypothetical protein
MSNNKKSGESALGLFGATISAVGILGAVCSYFGTVYVFFSTDRNFLGTLALFVPPADLVLSFVASPILGIAAVGGTLLFYLGIFIAGTSPTKSV